MASTLLTSNTYYANSGDNTIFRAYGTAWSNAFANAGWVKASDTGQIDWTTVVANGTTGVWSGSEIWRMNDALANTSPVYVKVDFGTTGSTNRPGIAMCVGHSTNGAVGLCGALSTNNVYQMSAPTSATAYPWYFVGANNYFAIIMWSGSQYPGWFAIERTKDANGADTAEGCYIHQGGTSSGTVQYWNIRTGAGLAENPPAFFGKPYNLNPTGRGNQFNWSPLYPQKGTFMPPSKLFVMGLNTHFAANLPVTLSHYGANMTYMMTTLSPTFRSTGLTPGTLMLMWE